MKKDLSLIIIIPSQELWKAASVEFSEPFRAYPEVCIFIQQCWVDIIFFLSSFFQDEDTLEFRPITKSWWVPLSMENSM